MRSRSYYRWTAKRCTRSALDCAIGCVALAVFDCPIASLFYGAVSMAFGLGACWARARATAPRERLA